MSRLPVKGTKMKLIRRVVLLGWALTLLVQVNRTGAGEQPPKPGEGEGQSIQVTGKLRTGIFAIGGETTGTTITAGGKTYELDLHQSPRLLQALAETLSGKEVVVQGTLRRDTGVEIRERWIIAVIDIRPASRDGSAPAGGGGEVGRSAGGPPQEAAVQSFSYKKVLQADLEMIVHYPPGWKEADKRPAIVFFFGGGWTNGNVKQFESQATHLARRGMVAARADYRVKSRHGVTPKECVEDAKSAVRWLRQHAAKLGIDPDRIVASGGSAGGHLAACTSLAPGLDAEGEDRAVSSQPNALVLFNPVLRLDLPPLQGYVGHDEALAKAISPTLYLTKDTPPTLLLYGSADRLAAQGEEFMKKSKELGQRAEMFTAEGQGHGFFNRSPWLEKTTQRMDEFLVSIGYLAPNAPSTRRP
jgi:acetyl esterase/lipase